MPMTSQTLTIGAGKPGAPHRSPHPIRAPPKFETRVLDYALQYPTHGAQRVNEPFRVA